MSEKRCIIGVDGQHKRPRCPVVDRLRFTFLMGHTMQSKSGYFLTNVYRVFAVSNNLCALSYGDKLMKSLRFKVFIDCLWWAVVLVRIVQLQVVRVNWLVGFFFGIELRGLEWHSDDCEIQTRNCKIISGYAKDIFVVKVNELAFTH